MSIGMIRVRGQYRTTALKFVSEPYAKIMEKIGFRRATEAEVLAHEKSRVRIEPVTVEIPAEELIRAGEITPNEVREAIGLEPIPALDDETPKRKRRRKASEEDAGD